MARRYERASLVLTSNKSFEDWGEVLGDLVMAAALIGRRVHHCHLVTIHPKSNRIAPAAGPLADAAHDPGVRGAARRRARQEVLALVPSPICQIFGRR